MTLPFLFSLRTMSNANGQPMQNRKNPFAKEKVKLPDLPKIELIRAKDSLSAQTHLTTSKVKYGDYEFSVCEEGYILSYIQSYIKRRDPQDVFYGVYYGRDHVL